MEKLKAVIVLLIIITAAIQIYTVNKYLQKVIRPRESLGRLLLYILAAMTLIFAATFVLVLTIRFLFPPTSK
jgi:uncharacterized membrane protein YidH (DUF202 family)